jgi:predicted small secreted protein
MSEFSGILSLLLIVAAFLTSCNPETQGDAKPIAPLAAQ